MGTSNDPVVGQEERQAFRRTGFALPFPRDLLLRLPWRDEAADRRAGVATRRRERLVWLDLFRGAAVLVMIETHVVNTFLATAVRAEDWFAVLNYINGLVAPSFLFIAGFAQGMERNSRAKQGAGGTPAKAVNFARRAWRLFGVGLIGYALHFPWAEIGQHRWDAAVRVGTQVDVLQCIAFSLGLLLLVSWWRAKVGDGQSEAADPEERFTFFRAEWIWWVAVTALLFVSVAMAPLAVNWRDLPVPLTAWVNACTGSWFPLFPWAGFVFAGALAGAVSGIGGAVEDRSTVGARGLGGRLGTAGVGSAVLLVAPAPLAVAAWAFRDAHYSSVSPASFFERVAWVLVLAVICQWLAAQGRRPAVVLFAGQRSLTLYVVHLVLISTLCGAGVPMQAFSLSAVLGMVAAVGGVSLALTWGIGRIWGGRRQLNSVAPAGANAGL